MNNQIKLTILGEPKAQKRHRHVSRGKFVRQYDPSAADKGDFLSIVQKNAPDKPFDCPLALSITFYFSRPKSHYRTGRNSGVLKDPAPAWHTSKPDIDNTIKLIFDSLNKVFWRDDSIISDCTVKKMYSENPRTEILIETL